MIDSVWLLLNQTFKITDESIREFQSTFLQYMEHTSRTLAQALNEKAYFIAVGAVRNTHKADYLRIERELGAHMAPVMGKRGKVLKRKRLDFSGKYYNQLAVKLIVSRLRKSGKKIPDKPTLQKMALDLVRARVRSVGFIRSGWIPAIKKLARASKYGSVKLPPDEFGRVTGQPKGDAKPAIGNDRLRTEVVFWNSAGAMPKHKGALMKYGSEGLRKSFAEERASMKKYIDDKLIKKTKELGIQAKG